MRKFYKNLYFCAIIMHMKYSSTEKTQFISQCFFLAFIESKNYKENLDIFIHPDDSGYSFRLKDFINHQKETKKTMGLIPVDVLVENECSPELIDKIEAEYRQNKRHGGYTRLFLEYLFNERFMTEFNKKVKKESSCGDLKKINYFTTKEEKGMFEFDLVEDYFNIIKDRFGGEEKDSDWSKEDFTFTEKKQVRSKHSEKASKKNPNSLTVEKLDNVYSAFKVFGQGNYSEILIALLKQKEVKKDCLSPELLRSKALVYIFDDEETVPIRNNKSKNEFVEETIKQNVSRTTSYSKTGNVYQRIYELQVSKTNELLQRFFEDYTPSHLDRVYTFSKDKRNKRSEMISGDVTLRGLLICEFKNIAKKQWKIYRALEVKNMEGSYETVSMRMNYYTQRECKKIKDEYEKLVFNINGAENDCQIEDMVEYILEKEFAIFQDKTWEGIINKYYGGEYYQEKSDDELKEEELKKLSKYNFKGYSKKLFDLLYDHFDFAPDFLGCVAKEIQAFSGDEIVYMAGIPKIVLANAIRNIVRCRERKEIYKCINNQVFLYSSLKSPPFYFNDNQIEKSKMSFLMENWRCHSDHPWQSFWMKHKKKFQSSDYKLNNFKTDMEDIYKQFKD